MIFLADENVQRTVVVRLRQRGFDIRHIREMTPGVPDDVVLDVANHEGAILLTYDRDFGELIFQQRRAVAGVILVRLASAGLPPTEIADLVAGVIEAHNAEIEQAFTVISHRGVRIRHLPLQTEQPQSE